MGNPGLGAYAGWILISLSQYIHKKITKKPPAKPTNQHILDVYLYNQVKAIASRIDNVGGIDAIEVSGNRNGRPVRAVLDRETKKYVTQLKDQVAFKGIHRVSS